MVQRQVQRSTTERATVFFAVLTGLSISLGASPMAHGQQAPEAELVGPAGIKPT
jgi:hypothetical protein